MCDRSYQLFRDQQALQLHNNNNNNGGGGGRADEKRSVVSIRSTAGVDEPSTDAQMVARTFRYMRRKPTIISYKPPLGSNELDRPTLMLH